MRHVRHLIAALAIVLALAPFAAIMLTAMFATLLGCDVNEAAPGPCLINGSDIGGLLSGLLVTGGLGQITIPILMVLLAIWGALEAGHWLRMRRRARKLGSAQ